MFKSLGQERFYTNIKKYVEKHSLLQSTGAFKFNQKWETRHLQDTT